MKTFLVLVSLMALNASAWTRWNNRYWSIDPKIYTNTSTPTNLRDRVPDAIDAWKLSGSGHWPVYGGLTGRDCGSGDTWWIDDDDGYNVVDYWSKCNGSENTSKCADGHLAITYPIDDYNTDSHHIAEVDIVMCSNWEWDGSHIESPSKFNYQGLLTHELGHLMGLNHSSNVSPEYNALLGDATMYFTAGPSGGTSNQSLNRDDISGIRNIYGAGFFWTLVNSSGINVTLTNPGGAGVGLSVVPPGTGTAWLNPIIVENTHLGGWIDSESRIEWQEYDRDHSIILALLVIGVDGAERWLYYARNASNWWGQWYSGGRFVNMSGYPSNYFTWQNIEMNVWADYRNAFGVDPMKCSKTRVLHWVYNGWTGDHGGTIRNIFLRGIGW